MWGALLLSTTDQASPFTIVTLKCNQNVSVFQVVHHHNLYVQAFCGIMQPISGDSVSVHPKQFFLAAIAISAFYSVKCNLIIANSCLATSILPAATRTS